MRFGASMGSILWVLLSADTVQGLLGLLLLLHPLSASDVPSDDSFTVTVFLLITNKNPLSMHKFCVSCLLRVANKNPPVGDSKVELNIKVEEKPRSSYSVAPPSTYILPNLYQKNVLFVIHSGLAT